MMIRRIAIPLVLKTNPNLGAVYFGWMRRSKGFILLLVLKTVAHRRILKKAPSLKGAAPWSFRNPLVLGKTREGT